MIQTLHIPPPLPLTPHYFRVDGLAKQRRLWRKMQVQQLDKSDGTRGITFSAVTSDRWEMKLRITNGDGIVDVIAKRPSEHEYAPDRQYASIWTRYVLQAAAMFVDTSMCTQFSREFFMPQLLQSRNPSNPPYMFAAKAAESKADVARKVKTALLRIAGCHDPELELGTPLAKKKPSSKHRPHRSDAARSSRPDSAKPKRRRRGKVRVNFEHNLIIKDPSRKPSTISSEWV